MHTWDSQEIYFLTAIEKMNIETLLCDTENIGLGIDKIKNQTKTPL